MNQFRRIIMSRLYKQLGFKGSKIPKDYEADLPGTVCPQDYNGEHNITLDLRISKSQARGHKVSFHRIFAKCPECSKYLPISRLQQHVGTGTCNG